MKAFMEEYGVIVVAAIVIMIIVVAASPIGDSIKSGIMEAVQKLTNALADANGVSYIQGSMGFERGVLRTAAPICKRSAGYRHQL